MKFKRFLAAATSAVLSAGMCLTPISAYAADSSTEYQSAAEDGSQTTTAYAEVAASFTVVIPKTVILTGSSAADNAVGSYTVKAYGNIPGEKMITVEPSSTVTMKQDNKSDVTASISQLKTTWQIGDGVVTEANVNDGDATKTTGTITASLSAGQWTGQFNFNISLTKQYVMLESPTSSVDGTGDATFRSSALEEDFESVKVDGTVVSPSNYDVTSGSTIIALHDDYISTLSNGTHTLEIVSNDGSVSADFTVAKSVSQTTETTLTNASIVGVITGSDGKPLSNAYVTLTSNGENDIGTISSDNEGTIFFDLSGTDADSVLTYTCEIDGYMPMHGIITAGSNTVTVLDIVMVPINDMFEKYEVTDDITGETVETYAEYFPDLTGNEEEPASPLITAAFPAGSLNKDDLITTFTTTYAVAEDHTAPAENSYSETATIELIAEIGTSEATTAMRPYTVTLSGAEAEPEAVYMNGEEITGSAYDSEKDLLSFQTTEFGTIRVIYPVYETMTASKKTSVTFTPSEFTGYFDCITAKYSCNAGSEINGASGLAAQAAALFYGNSGVTALTRALNIVKTIPAGETAILSGYQTVSTVTLRIGIKAMAMITTNGNLTYTLQDRVHT